MSPVTAEKRQTFQVILLLVFWLVSRLIIESLLLRIVTSANNILFPVYYLFFAIIFLIMLFPLFSLRWPVILIIAFLGYSAYLFTNINYYYYYRIPMDLLGVMTVAGDGIKAFVHGSTIFRIEWLLPLLDLPVFILILIKYRQIHRVFYRIRKKQLYVIAIVIIFFTGQLVRLSGEAKNDSVTHNQIIKNHGLLVYSAARPFVFPPESRELLIALKQDDGTVIKRDINGRINKIENTNKYGFKKWPGYENADFNFLMIQVESLQSGIERIRHNGKLVMPFLHYLSKNSVYYPYCFSYHTAGGSSDSEISIFNNIEPADGKRMTSRDFNHEGSFLKLMPGYHKIAFHNYIKSFFNRGNSYPKIGFDIFYDFNGMELPGKAWGSEDRLMWEYIINNSKKWKTPFFHYAITLTSHPGFGHIGFYYTADFLEDIKRKRDKDALSSFNYVDIQLRKFIGAYRKLYPNTYIFIYGDHSLSTVNFAGHLERSGVTFGEDYLEFVPLFIITPDNKIENNSNILASFHDLGPTVLSLSKRPPESEYIQYPAFGGSLFNDNVNTMPIPFNGKLLDRTMVLKAVKAIIEPYFMDE